MHKYKNILCIYTRTYKHSYMIISIHYYKLNVEENNCSEI